MMTWLTCKIPLAVSCAAIVAFTFLPHPQPAFAAEPSPTQARSALAAQCDALLESAIRSPFGWGWSDEDPQAAPDPAPGRRPARPAPASHKPIAIDTAETSVLGLELYW